MLSGFLLEWGHKGTLMNPQINGTLAHISGQITIYSQRTQSFKYCASTASCSLNLQEVSANTQTSWEGK